jgi:competence protein ComFC
VAGKVDLITWAPTSPQRHRFRGFDQAEVLANYVSLLLGIPVASALVHRSESGRQTGHNRQERSARADTTLFEATNDLSGLVVLLIDDVMTTGSTLRAAAGALHRAGSRSVHAAVAAATP